LPAGSGVVAGGTPAAALFPAEDAAAYPTGAGPPATGCAVAEWGSFRAHAASKIMGMNVKNRRNVIVSRSGRYGSKHRSNV